MRKAKDPRTPFSNADREDGILKKTLGAEGDAEVVADLDSDSTDDLRPQIFENSGQKVRSARSLQYRQPARILYGRAAEKQLGRGRNFLERFSFCGRAPEDLGGKGSKRAIVWLATGLGYVRIIAIPVAREGRECWEIGKNSSMQSVILRGTGV
jgi:hypothetical protein